MTVLYLVRHGETDWNREQRLQGTRDVPLNETGVAQAHELADYFAALGKQLNLDMKGDFKQMAPVLHRFLHDIEDAPVPAGLPVFGQAPREDQLRDAVSA